jgi:uncharacterized protein YdiU (UPF0061 family)
MSRGPPCYQAAVCAMGLVTNGYQDGGAALVVGDAAIEFFQVTYLREGNVQLFDFKGAGVAKYITLGHGLAVVATKAKVQTGGRRTSKPAGRAISMAP